QLFTSAFCEIHLPLEPRWCDRDVLASAGLEESLCCLHDSRACGRTFHRYIRNQLTDIARALAWKNSYAAGFHGPDVWPGVSSRGDGGAMLLMGKRQS